MPELDAVVPQRIDVAPGLMNRRMAPVGWTLPAFTSGRFTVRNVVPIATGTGLAPCLSLLRSSP